MSVSVDDSAAAAQRAQDRMVRIAAEVSEDPQGALRSAQRVLREAREHKRLSAVHKRRAKIAMSKFEAFKINLEALGIEVIVEATNAQEGTSDHRSRTSSN